MKSEITEAFVKPLSPLPDDHDIKLHDFNREPALVTQRLRELVPLLEFVDCKVEVIEPEKTMLSLPLLPSAMNQNGTHQAAIFYLVADYTIGVGMFGALPGIYVTGVHDRCNALPVQYWLKAGTVRHLAPGTGPLIAEVNIPAEVALQLRKQLIDRGRCELTQVVRFYQEGTLVAETEHTMGMYADIPRRAGLRANIFQVQNLKTSALMIAGLRDDPLSHKIAQDQGRAIANRMTLAAPQLPSLVAARTTHIENYLRENARIFSQVLVLAVGLDPKPVRFSSRNQRWFGLDLKEMLRERESRFANLSSQAMSFTPVAADLRLDSWDQTLIKSGFESGATTLIIMEGITMYLSSFELAQLLRKLRAIVGSAQSRLWMDHVSSSLFSIDILEVKSFLASMTRLGEPFVLGYDDISALSECKWVTEEKTSAAAVLEISEAVHQEYFFSILITE